MPYAICISAGCIIRAGTLLAKLDLQHAYRIVPVHPDDHHLLGSRWGREVYIDTALPFGLRSAPKIFSAIADAIAWILHTKGVTYQLHYLDDFLLLGPPDGSQCGQALSRTLQVCQELGVPIATHKTEGPSCQLTFLGIHIDSIKMELSLPPDKLTRITPMVLQWRGRKVASKMDLQSLIGVLSHAATVVPPGRTFLRRMIESMKIPKCQHHHVRLNSEFRSDIQWWANFLPQWSILPNPQATHSFKSDTSGAWGCGAVNDSACWFQTECPQSWQPRHIAAKEMVPVVIAFAIWGRSWLASCICSVAYTFSRPISKYVWKRTVSQGWITQQLMHYLAISWMCFCPAHPRHPPPHHPLHSHSWTCCFTTSQTGHLPVGGECFSLPWEGISPIHRPLLWYWPALLHGLLPGCKFPTPSTNRAHSLHFCGSSSKRRAHSSDYKILPVSTPTLSHNVRPRRSIHRKCLSSSTISAKRNQEVTYMYSQTATPTSHTHNPAAPEG